MAQKPDISYEIICVNNASPDGAPLGYRVFLLKNRDSDMRIMLKMINNNRIKNNSYSPAAFTIGLCLIAVFVTTVYSVAIIADAGQGSDFAIHNNITLESLMTTSLLLEPLYKLSVFVIHLVLNVPIAVASVFVMSASVIATIVIARTILHAEISGQDRTGQDRTGQDRTVTR
jgi:hypothetical protein